MISRLETIVIIISVFVYIEAQEEKTCGKRLVHHNALITNGFLSKEGDWPWHAALYYISHSTISYKCGGTLLTTNTILTAAHCVFENNIPISPERVFVYLGRHNLRVSGTNSQTSQVFLIIPHPNYNPSDQNNDIAILRLSTEVTFNNYVQPICLWDSKKLELSNVVGKFGTVIGWGLTETDELSHILRQAFMPVVPSLTCLTTNRDFFGSHLSETNFCAGFRNGTTVCNGDSGGSMTFEKNGVYYIRGIVSVSVSRRGNYALCDPNHYVIFTDVAKYLPWIEKTVPQLKSAESKLDWTDKISIIDTQECGISKSETDSDSEEEKWPWLVPLFTKLRDTFLCGSNIINNQFLLSVAHCFQHKGAIAPTPASTIYAYLGRYDLKSLKENFSLKSNIKRILIHPDWNSNVPTYDGNIALLRTTNVISFTDYIQPICLPTADSVIFNVKGIVIGSGRTEDVSSNETLSKKIAVKSVNEDVCRSNPALVHFTSQRMFCVEEQERTPCKDDIGSGFYVKNAAGIYGIIGLVSMADCHRNKFALFTSVPNFIPWIFQSLNYDDNDDDDVSDWKCLTTNCDCKKRVRCSTIVIDPERNGIACNVDLVIKLTDQNCVIIFDEFPKTNVTGLIIWGELEALPDLSDAYRIFKNINYLGFGWIKIKEVKRNKLTSLRKVSWLNFWGNEISELAANTFDDLLEIDKLVLAENRLKVVHRDLFKELRKITEIYLQKNQLEVLPEGLFRNNQELKNIYVSENNLKTIAADFRNLPKLVAIDFSSNQCINEWCLVASFCGTSSKTEMQTKIWNKCNIPRNR